MQGEAVAVRGARAHRQQVVVARDVAVPGKVVRVLRVTGNNHTAGSLDDTDGRFWDREREREEDFKFHPNVIILNNMINMMACRSGHEPLSVY